MPNEKMENLLNLALAATQEEREKSLELDIGYDSAKQTWEVIVKFVGTTEELEALLFKNFPEEYPRIRLTNLQNEYAVLVLPEHLVEPVAALDKIEYMEKPKLLFFAVDNGKRASCITQLQERTGLSGAGVESGGNQKFLPQFIFLRKYNVIGKYFQICNFYLVIILTCFFIYIFHNYYSSHLSLFLPVCFPVCKTS